MDRLESLHAQRMSEVQQRFRSCLTDMEVEFDAERAEIQATQARGRKEANDIMEAMQRDCEELENEVSHLGSLIRTGKNWETRSVILGIYSGL